MSEKIKFGHFPGMKIGDTFRGRKDMKGRGLHISDSYGISYDANELKAGADAIVMSGGYHDEISEDGNHIDYEGMGGRKNIPVGVYINKKGEEKVRKKQVVNHNQTLTRGNAALNENIKLGEPVRVFKAVKKGLYKYMGLYGVNPPREVIGEHGFIVYKFPLSKVPEEQYPYYPFNDDQQSEIDHPSPKRKGVWINSISRESMWTEEVKQLYENRCQICGLGILDFKGNMYSEGAHIKGLGKPHNGPDRTWNILSLCSNHHKAFDRGSIVIKYNSSKRKYEVISVLDFDDLEKRVIGSLTVHKDHKISKKMIEYHYDYVLEQRSKFLGKAN